MATSSSAASIVQRLSPKQHQVFINFRGAELRHSFISHLEEALKNGKIKYYIDMNDVRSESIDILLKRIEESDIAIAVLSKRYSESKWCLKELVKIMERVNEKKLRVIPVYFDVKVDDVKEQKGEFGVNLVNNNDNETISNMLVIKAALRSVARYFCLSLEDSRTESDLVTQIVASVKDVIAILEKERTNVVSTNISSLSCSRYGYTGEIKQTKAALPCYGMQQCIEKLKEKLDLNSKETQILGIVGMPGIGKTTLAKMYFNKFENKFAFKRSIQDIRENSIDDDWVKNIILTARLDRLENGMGKAFLLLDDVSDKKQIEFLRTNPEQVITKGSKIVITTRDKGLIEELADDTYVVPGLNDKEALQLFTHHALNDQLDYTEHFYDMSKKFVDYAGGNPRALEELGKELFNENEEHQWRKRLETLPHLCNENIRRGLRISYDELTEQQKHAFLDIACFFRSEEKEYVRVLLDSYDTDSGEAAKEVKDLADKFLISISGGRIEMHNLLCTLGKEIGSPEENHLGKSRLWNHQDAVDTLLFQKGTNIVRGIFLDTSKIKEMALGSKAFIKMQSLRYVKIFDSRCPRQCEVVDCKINLPDGLEFPSEEIRYLHWLKFPLEELPSDFNAEKLIDLRLPYSKIQRVWTEIKETPNLKWVDLSHSRNLIDMSALSNAESLRRLNLEGCTKLVQLPGDMENMKNLAFLNLRGCISLVSFPKMKKNLISLKTLILSDCSNLNEFQVISENLEYLHLDGTAIESLPLSIQNLGRLIVLNLKDCKKLESLPDCLDKLKALEELILSGCSNLMSFPDVKKAMKNLQILLFDGTSIKELPNGLLHCGNNSIGQVAFQTKQPRMNGLSLLRRLCLSRNDTIRSLQSSISQLYHLKWLDLKYCEKLTSIPSLPPNLQCLDAHACISLKTVASPLALLLPLTEQVPSSYIFTNCEKLEHVAKNEIICYAHNKSRMISDALNRQNKGLGFEALVATCFPGSEVPTWFNHRASGAFLEPELPRHWSESGFVGIALCAIVSFQNYKIQNNNLMVKCICEFNNVVGAPSTSFFNCNAGGLSEASDEKRTIKSTHVFIGFTSWLNINKCQEVAKKKKGCIPTTASIKFKVTDGAYEATGCEVLKCGFSLVCESDNGSWDASIDASPMAEELKQVEGRFLGLFRRALSSKMYNLP